MKTGVATADDPRVQMARALRRWRDKRLKEIVDEANGPDGWWWDELRTGWGS